MTLHLHENHERALAALLEVHQADPGPVGHLAAVVADLVGELGATEDERLADLLPAARIDHAFAFLERLEARVTALELAITETNRRVPAPRPETSTTFFGIPVALAEGVTKEQIRDAAGSAPKGLDARQVVNHLAEAGLLRVVE